MTDDCQRKGRPPRVTTPRQNRQHQEKRFIPAAETAR